MPEGQTAKASCSGFGGGSSRTPPIDGSARAPTAARLGGSAALQQEPLQLQVALLPRGVDRPEAARLLGVHLGTGVEQQPDDLDGAAVRSCGMDRLHLELVMAGPQVRVRAAFEQQADRLRMLEEGGEGQRGGAVGRERVRIGAGVQQLAQATGVAKSCRLERTELGLLAPQSFGLLGTAFVKGLKQRRGRHRIPFIGLLVSLTNRVAGVNPETLARVAKLSMRPFARALAPVALRLPADRAPA